MTFDPNKYQPGIPPWLEGTPEQPRMDVVFGSDRGPKEQNRTIFSFNLEQLSEAWEKTIGWLRG